MDPSPAQSYDSSFYFTKAAVFIPGVTGSVSSIASIIILSIILRSERKLSTTYHRIMFFMSFWDIVASISVALTTLPMPKDVIYPYSGFTAGNRATCTAQGFLIFFGTALVFGGNIALNIYYLCAIRYKMRDDQCRRILEPALLFMVLSLSLIPSIIFLERGLYNPTPFSPFCALGPYPWDRNTPHRIYKQIMAVFIIGILAGLLIILLSMVLIICSTYQSERQTLKSIRRSSSVQFSSASLRARAGLEVRHDDDGTIRRLERNRARREEEVASHLKTKRIMFEAMLYVGAFLLTHLFFICTFLVPEKWYLQMLRLMFAPLQGFFNALIFIYHKIHLLRVANVRLRFSQALRDVLLLPIDVPDILISELIVIAEDEYNAKRLTLDKRLYVRTDKFQHEGVEGSFKAPGDGSESDDDISFSSTSARMMLEIEEQKGYNIELRQTEERAPIENIDENSGGSQDLSGCLSSFDERNLDDLHLATIEEEVQTTIDI